LFVFSCDDDNHPTFPIIPGCIDAFACNFDITATIDDGTCIYAQDNYNCDGICEIGYNCNTICVDSAMECYLCDAILSCFNDCGTDINLVTGEIMCPNDSYSLDTGFNLSGPDDTAVDINVVINDNQFYSGFEVDPNTGDYIVAIDPFTEQPIEDALGNPIYIPTQFAIDLYDQCVTLGCISQQYNALFAELVINLSDDEMSLNNIYDEGEYVFSNIAEMGPFSICGCANFDSEGVMPPQSYYPNIWGCMDSYACNYNPDATINDNSCYYTECN